MVALSGTFSETRFHFSSKILRRSVLRRLRLRHLHKESYFIGIVVHFKADDEIGLRVEYKVENAVISPDEPVSPCFDKQMRLSRLNLRC